MNVPDPTAPQALHALALPVAAPVAYEAALRILRQASALHDGDTGVHMSRVGELSALLAQWSGLPAELAPAFACAAELHDVGKLGIPDAVLGKPGKLTATERTVIETHPALGARILQGSRMPVFELASHIALSHHECWNGSGYPNGLSAAAIPWAGRVVSLIDFFDALTMRRAYHEPMPDAQALSMVSAQRGIKFDPELVDLFISRAGELIALRDRLNKQADEHGQA